MLISGTVFNDANNDARKNSGEAGLLNWRVYIDADNDGRFDSGEKSVLTDGSGNYRFTSLAAGTHRVRILQQSAWTRTTPTSGVHTLTLATGAIATDKHFGQRRS
ncbi:MAG TPA: SdrD B-like domain-containing protein [Tepidisphaeraceae bacterium]|nr:SdrD B-like domain-containing protein [Tepidisphaeraceae bacterium]